MSTLARSSSVSVTIPAVTQASSWPVSTANFTHPANRGKTATRRSGSYSLRKRGSIRTITPRTSSTKWPCCVTRSRRRSLTSPRRFFNARLKWLKLLHIGDWELRVSVGDVEQSLGENFCVQAENTGQARYMQVVITGDFATIQGMSDDDLDDLACHEVMHSVIGPVAELLDEVITALPAEQRQTYNDWRNREVEGVTSHLTGVVQARHRAPRGT